MYYVIFLYIFFISSLRMMISKRMHLWRKGKRFFQKSVSKNLRRISNGNQVRKNEALTLIHPAIQSLILTRWLFFLILVLTLDLGMMRRVRRMGQESRYLTAKQYRVSLNKKAKTSGEQHGRQQTSM